MRPDLAVEVVSPHDTAEEVNEKVQEWLDAGVRVVWIVSPNTRNTHIHRPRGAACGTVSQLTTDDNITGEDVLPEFSCSVGEFFADV